MSRIRNSRRNLAQGSNVIQNPERTSVCGHDQVVILDPQIAHGCTRKVQLQGLPAISIIERNPDSIFCAREQQALADGIFAHGIDGAEVRQSGRDQFPALAAVVRAIDVGMRVVDAEAAHRGIGSVLVEMRWGELGDLAPWSQLFGGDVSPVLPAIASDPKQAVIGSGPQSIERLE